MSAHFSEFFFFSLETTKKKWEKWGEREGEMGERDYNLIYIYKLIIKAISIYSLWRARLVWTGNTEGWCRHIWFSGGLLYNITLIDFISSGEMLPSLQGTCLGGHPHTALRNSSWFQEIKYCSIKEKGIKTFSKHGERRGVEIYLSTSLFQPGKKKRHQMYKEPLTGIWFWKLGRGFRLQIILQYQS